MRMKLGTRLAMLLLALVAVAHVLRLVLGVEVVVDGWVAPMWVSIVGALIPAGLAFLIYREH